MIVSINLIALGDELGDGAYRYIKMILRHLGDYHIYDCKFIIYKQEQISKEYINVPVNLNCEYVNVPNLGCGFKRILFEQTIFYRYLLPCDVFYSYCTSLPLLVKAKKVFTLHDVYSFTVNGRFSLIRKLYLRNMTKIYVKLANKILTVSENSKNDIIKYLGVNNDKIIITNNFIIKPETKILNDKVLYDIYNREVDLNKPFFLYVGSLHNGKNIKGLCESFSLFCKKNQGYSLILVGKILENKESYINLLNSNQSLYYLGYQAREVIETLLNNCYATVLFSFYEGFGIPPLEGFYYSKPTIVSNTSSLPEVVGKAGVYVDPYSLQDMASGFERLIKSYDNCLQHVQEQLDKFSPDKSVENFMDAIGIKYKSKFVN